MKGRKNLVVKYELERDRDTDKMRLFIRIRYGRAVSKVMPCGLSPAYIYRHQFSEVTSARRFQLRLQQVKEELQPIVDGSETEAQAAEMLSDYLDAEKHRRFLQAQLETVFLLENELKNRMARVYTYAAKNGVDDLLEDIKAEIRDSAEIKQVLEDKVVYVKRRPKTGDGRRKQ